MFRRAFKYTNSSVFQIGGESIIMLIIGVLVAMVLVPLDLCQIKLHLPTAYNNNLVVGTIYTLYVFLVLYLLVFLYHLIAERRKILDHKEIKHLGEHRTIGIDLRNTMTGITEQDELDILIELYDRWDSDMLNTLALISPGESSWLKSLDRMPEASGRFINPNHRRYVRVLNEKLRRLDVVIRKYLNLPQDN